MPGRDILGNDAPVAPAALARAVVPSFVFFLGSDRRFVQEMRDQSILSLKGRRQSALSRGVKTESVAHL